MMIQPTQLNGLYLFKALIKSGCEWHGDVISKKWSEALFIPEGVNVERDLEPYTEGVEYMVEDRCIWIA